MRLRFRFHQHVVISLVALPPTNEEAADLADRFRFRISVHDNDEMQDYIHRHIAVSKIVANRRAPLLILSHSGKNLRMRR